jgi:hypothetical protein
MLTGFLFSGCSVSTKSMKSPKYHVEFYKTDFNYSQQVSAEATSVRVLGIDWRRFFNWNNGTIKSDMSPENSGGLHSISVASDGFAGAITFAPSVVGELMKGKTASYALYKLMQENPGYDVIIYPQYEMKKKGFPLIYTKTKVKVKARLAKINR